ncbi:hypothetical protein D3C76_490390 [compost metagenome]
MIFEVSVLDRRCIDKLVSQEVLAVRVSGFIPSSLALDIAGQLMDCGLCEQKEDGEAVLPGFSFDKVHEQPELIDRYFEQAPACIAALRRCCAPYLSPVDTLRCMLDETWPAGSHLQSMDGRKMLAGLPRILKPDMCFLARQDVLEPRRPRAQPMRQLACNIHLSVPENGGELQIWQHLLGDEKFDALRDGSPGIDPILLGEPSVRLKPEPGELVIFDSRLLHAVSPGEGSPHMSLSLFIGYRGETLPLTCWS